MCWRFLILLAALFAAVAFSWGGFLMTIFKVM
jgi:hypothetical protein